jgi:DNA-binding MarR family transcriptional regulator
LSRERRLIGELLRNPNAARVRHVERGFAAAGHSAIHPPHLPVFEYMDRQRGSRVTDLARHANVSAQAMTEVVVHLERHGYVERVPDPSDGRARLVRLTARGQEVYAVARELILELERSWAARLGEPKFVQLKELLGELWDAVGADADGRAP